MDISYINKKEMPPLVSIIIPVYNNAAYLEKCFDSALEQSYENIEVIAVDDCSSDTRVEAILNRYKQHDKFRVYKNEKNSGICITTNNAIKKSEGDWLAFLDCDDWLDTTAIRKMMDVLTAHPGSTFGYSNRINYNNKTGEMEEVDFGCRPTENYYKNLTIGMYTSHLKIVHKSVFARIGLFDQYYNGTQDYDISLKTAFYLGDRAFAFLREPVYYHRIHEVQTTQRMSNDMDEKTLRLKDEAKKRLEVLNGTLNVKISFIILSFNKKIQTLECIESIRSTVKLPYEVILLDNNSTQDTKDFIKTHIEPMPEVKVFYSKNNLGPAGGRKEAVKYAQGDYLMFLDNDIVLLENWLPELLIRIERDDKVGAVNCKVLFPDDKVNFNALKSTLNPPYIHFELIGFGMNQGDMVTCEYDENDWIPAGATLYKAEVFKLLEGLEDYPNTYEDNDAGMQLAGKGYKMLNSPASIVLHNHYTYNVRRTEREYLEERYNTNNLIKSSLTFYKRHRLIIKDDFVLGKLNLLGKSAEEVIEEFEKRIQQPKVSVIVPVYNTSKYLDECLNSLVNQSLKDIEIICINDGSLDDSLEKMTQYAENDARIQIIDKQNTGYGHSVNQGIIQAKGEYIGILESDDFAELDMFEKLYEKAKVNNVEVIKSNFYEYKTRPEKKNIYMETLKAYGYDTVFTPENKQEIFFTHSAVWSSIYKRDFLLKNDIWFTETEGASYQDTAFAFKVWACAQKVILTKEAFVHYRSDNSNSSVASSKKVFCICKEFQEIEEFLRLRPEKQKKLLPMEIELKFKIYKWNYQRIAAEYQYAFLLKAVEVFKYDCEMTDVYPQNWLVEDGNEFNLMINNMEEYYKSTKKKKNNIEWQIWNCTQNNLAYLKGLIEYIKTYDTIIIYGAGIIGKEFAKYLDKNGIQVYAFAVTEELPINEMNNIPIVQIDSLLKYNNVGIVVVATRVDYQKEIVEKLQQLTFENILVIDEWLRQALK